MENFVVSARKYRPQKFEAVVGQQSITKTLENAIKNNHLAQAFLFCGPRGVGKTTCARILAKTINAESMGNVAEDEDFSFNIFELDAASNNSVEDIRSLTDQVRIAPQLGKYKVYIIDEVHMLSSSAFNAFLKTLEEPPAHAIFILATTEKHKIIPTILSRCQIFDFKRIEIKDIVDHLATIAKTEGVSIEEEALHIIAQKADGALRDALSIFDQIVSFSGNNITYQNVIDNLNVLDYDYYFKLTDYIYNQDISSALLLFDEILYKGFDGHNFIVGLASHFRNLLVCKNKSTLKLLEVSDNVKEKYYHQANTISDDFFLKALKICSEADVNYKSAKNQRLLVEFALIQLCSLQNQEAEKKNTNSEQPTLAPFAKSKSQIAEKPADKKQVEEPKPQEIKSPDKPVAEPEIKTSENNQPLNRTRSSKLSLNKLLSEPKVTENKEDAQKNNLYVEGHEDFKVISQGALDEAWESLKKSFVNEGGMFYSTLNKNHPKVVEKNKIHLVLHSMPEEIELKNRQADIIVFLREKLEHPYLNLSWELVTNATTKSYYTNRDKFDRMAELNPILLELKKRLDLEVD